jgi:UTP--glucose-1-phosphate uridylyltransferase
MKLDIISNPKLLDDGRSVIQVIRVSLLHMSRFSNTFKLETAAGSAVKHFKNAHGIEVPRSRFLPVKNCSNLLLVKSDLYVLEHGRLVMNENRMFGIPPVIKLSGHFKKV